MGITVFGACFVDIKGYPLTQYIPAGRNVGRVVQVHGGVSRNVVEDIANVELRPTFVSVVDHTGTSTDVIEKLNNHKVNTTYMRRTEDGLGTWLAIFDNNGDVIGSVSKRPDLKEITDILNEYGDEIFSRADSIVVEIDMEAAQIRQILDLAERHGKEVYAVVSNMSIALERRDLLQRTGCIVCNEQEAGMLFSEDYEYYAIDELKDAIIRRIQAARIPRISSCFPHPSGREDIFRGTRKQNCCTKNVRQLFFDECPAKNRPPETAVPFRGPAGKGGSLFPRCGANHPGA